MRGVRWLCGWWGSCCGGLPTISSGEQMWIAIREKREAFRPGISVGGERRGMTVLAEPGCKLNDNNPWSPNFSAIAVAKTIFAAFDCPYRTWKLLFNKFGSSKLIIIPLGAMLCSILEVHITRVVKTGGDDDFDVVRSRGRSSFVQTKWPMTWTPYILLIIISQNSDSEVRRGGGGLPSEFRTPEQFFDPLSYHSHH